MDLEYLIKENFQFYRAATTIFSLVLITVFQLFFPYRLALRRVLANWKVNMPVAVINVVFLSLLCGACVCTWAVLVRGREIHLFVLAGVPYWLEIVLTLLWLDFVAWFWHRANHVSPFLWRFHSVHHSDIQFEASTAFRFHPGELLISLGIRLIAVTVTGLPIAGLILFEAVFGFCNLFVHSDIRLPPRLERTLGYVFVTPFLHRIHHSVHRHERDQNYGTIFSFWDRGARTLLHVENAIEVGLPRVKGKQLNLGEVLLLPLNRGRADTEA